MNDTGRAFRLIVVRYKRQAELFDDQPRYHVIASNRVEPAAATLIWYRQRGEVSENGIKELKIGFGMERKSRGQVLQSYIPPFPMLISLHGTTPQN